MLLLVLRVKIPLRALSRIFDVASIRDVVTPKHARSLGSRSFARCDLFKFSLQNAYCGEEPRDLAGQAEAQGETAKARDLSLRAAAVYRIARFPINRSPLGQKAWERGKAAKDQLWVVFETQPESGSARLTELRLEQKPEKGWPLLLFICGLDPYKTDYTPRTQEHVDHGFATLSFEIPCTGDCPAAPSDPGLSRSTYKQYLRLGGRQQR